MNAEWLNYIFIKLSPLSGTMRSLSAGVKNVKNSYADLKPQALSSQTIKNDSPVTIKSIVTFEESKSEEESTSWDASFESSVTFR